MAMLTCSKGRYSSSSTGGNRGPGLKKGKSLGRSHQRGAIGQCIVVNEDEWGEVKSGYIGVLVVLVGVDLVQNIYGSGVRMMTECVVSCTSRHNSKSVSWCFPISGNWYGTIVGTVGR